MLSIDLIGRRLAAKRWKNGEKSTKTRTTASPSLDAAHERKSTSNRGGQPVVEITTARTAESVHIHALFGAQIFRRRALDSGTLRVARDESPYPF